MGRTLLGRFEKSLIKRDEIFWALAQQDVLVEGATAAAYEQPKPFGMMDRDTEPCISRRDLGKAKKLERR
jgi:hypothetical protein